MKTPLRYMVAVGVLLGCHTESPRAVAPPLTLAEIIAAVEGAEQIVVEGERVNERFAPPNDSKAFAESLVLSEKSRLSRQSEEYDWRVIFRNRTKEEAVFQFTLGSHSRWKVNGREMVTPLNKQNEFRITDWLKRLGVDGPAKELARRSAVMARARELEERRLMEFPERSHEAWKIEVRRKDPDNWENSPNDHDEKVNAVWQAIGNPQLALECVFRAGGAAPLPWNMVDDVTIEYEKIVGRASTEQLVAALESSLGNKSAMFGAAPLLLNNHLDRKILDRLPADARAKVVTRALDAVLALGTEGTCRRAILAIARAGVVEATPAVRRVLSREFVPQPETDTQLYPSDKRHPEDPSLRALACFVLGMLGDSESMAAIRGMLAATNDESDKVIMEIGLTLLSADVTLTRRHFDTRSFRITECAVLAAERVGGRKALDLLVEFGLASRQSSEAIKAISRLLAHEAPQLNDEFVELCDQQRFDRIPKWWKTVRGQITKRM